MSGGISGILPVLAEKDTKERLAGVARLQEHLQRHGVDDTSTEGSLVDSLVGVLGDNNFKICQTALCCLELVVEHLGSRFRSYFNVVLNSLVERLGDNKATVRAKALDVLQWIVRALSPASCIDKVVPLFSHKNARVREQCLYCICNTLEEHGPDVLSLPKMLPHLVKRLDDSQKDVRQAAISVLEEWYRYVGGPLRNELMRRDIRPAITKMLFERFDDVEAGGGVEANLALMTGVGGGGGDTNLSRNGSMDSLGGSDSRGSTPGGGPAGRQTAVPEIDSSSDRPIRNSATPRSSGPPGPQSARKAPRAAAASPRSSNTQTEASTGVTLWWDQGCEGAIMSTCSGEVRAKQVYSDKELLKEVEAILPVLKGGVECDWNDRMTAMKRVQTLVLGGCSEFGAWEGILKELREHLVLQLTDLRSAIIRDACGTIALMAACCPEAIEPHIEAFIEAMLKLTTQSIAVINMAGVQGTRSSINSCVAPRCVTKILEICGTKAPAHRRRAIELLAQILETYPHSILDRLVGDIFKAVKTYVSDKDANCRLAARACFFAFSALWEGKGQELFNACDPSMQRVLEREGEEYVPGALGRELGTGTRSAKSKGGKSGSSTPSSRAQSATKSRAVRHEEGTPRAKPTSSRTQAAATPNGRPPMMERQRSDGVLQSRTPAASANRGGTAASGGSARSTSVGRAGRAGAAGGNKGAKAKPAVGSSASGGRSEKPARPKASTASSPRVDSNRQGNGSAGGGNFAQVARDSAEQLRTMFRDHEPPVSQEESRQPPSRPPVSRPPAPAPAPDDLRSLMALCEDTEWSIRTDSFAQLQIKLSSSVHRAEVLNELHALTRLHIQHLTDPHYRVCLAVLNGIEELLCKFPDPMAGYIERLLPRLIQKVLDPKELVRERADEVTEQLLCTCRIDSTMPVLLRLLEGQNQRIQLTALTWLAQLISDGQLTSAPHMKTVLVKGAPHAHDKSVEIRQAVGELVQAMYDVDPSQLFTNVLALPSQQQSSIKQLMVPMLPQFEGQLSMHRQRSREGEPSHRPARQHTPRDDMHNDLGAETEDWPPTQLSAARGQPSSSRSSKHEPASDVGYHPSMYSPSTADRGVVESRPPPLPQDKSRQADSQPDARQYYSASPAPAAVEGGGAAGNGSVSANMVPSLLSDMSSASPQRRKDSLHKIIRLCRSGTSWVSYFGQILLVVLEALCDAEPVIRELSLVVIKEMLRSQPTSFVDFIEVVMVKLLEKYRDSTREVCQAAEDALEQLISAVNPNRCVDTLIPLISSEGGAVLQASIRMLSKLVPMLPPMVLLEHVPQMCPGLFDAFKNPCADVRKAVVFCLVDIYMVLGDDFAPYLGELNTSQLKLVTIYINRTMQQRGIQRNPGQTA